MNTLTSWLTTKVALTASLVGAVVGIASGYPTLLQVQPFFALKQTVIENERKATYNRINDLGFQIDYLQMWDDPNSADTLRRKIEERDYLECTFQYRECRP